MISIDGLLLDKYHWLKQPLDSIGFVAITGFCVSLQEKWTITAFLEVYKMYSFFPLPYPIGITNASKSNNGYRLFTGYQNG